MWTLICEAALYAEDSAASGKGLARNGCSRLVAVAIRLGAKDDAGNGAPSSPDYSPTEKIAAEDTSATSVPLTLVGVAAGGVEATAHAAAAAPPVDATALDPTARQIRVYMHPGRMLVGVIDLNRARLQFDLARALLFHSFDEAERACAGRAGFLLEVCAAYEQDANDGSVLFVESLRGV